ncbi:MAG TPA: hypothetical protein VGC50_05080 [Gammaproteobacteria bacterium]|jgi:pimeloyl-ACP methyl ester carboxylesterase
MRQVVVLHGWSDDSESFKPLIAFLKRNGYEVTPLFLGDYISMRDEVRIEDVARRMEEVVREKMAKPADARDRLDKTFDLIVHSTGGLLARRWIAEYCKDGACPVRNFLMLAPANFGSVLAHKGRSMIGRLFKGGLKTGFQVGEEMLYALELGSSFQWELAQRDLFVPAGDGNTEVFYGADKTRPFVITGTHAYKGLGRDLINENGSDGTVRVAAANLNAHGITVDFTASLTEPRIEPWGRRGGAELEFPIAVLPDRDHGNVIDPDADGHANDPEYQARLAELIVDALGTQTAAQYQAKVESWNAVTRDTRTLAGLCDGAGKRRQEIFGRSPPDSSYFHEHYQIVVRAEDQFGAPILDYFIEFFPTPEDVHRFTQFRKASHFFHDKVLEHTHVHRRNAAHRCFFVDRYDLMREGGFYSMIPKDSPAGLAFTATAADPGPHVSHFAHGVPSKRGVVELHGTDKADRWLKRHCTHFIRMIVPRVGAKELFKLTRA